MNHINALLVDDDVEYLELLKHQLPSALEEVEIWWDTCPSFEEAQQRLRRFRYDMVVTDVYRGSPESKDVAAKCMVDQIRQLQFCPIVLVSSGPQPDELELTAFVKFADKSNQADLDTAIRSLVATGIPAIARNLHDSLNSFAGSYLWHHLTMQWDNLNQSASINHETLQRIIRKRAAVQLSRISGDDEIDTVKGAEFYLYPPISQAEYRLGDVIRDSDKSTFRVVLTPHCFLTIQKGQKEPRVSEILTIKTTPAELVIKDGKDWSPADRNKQLTTMSSWIRPNPKIGSPQGRYWFLPGFLEIPNLYCDFLKVESLPLSDIQTKYERVATIDAPFAESLQSCFAGFYSSIGTANLDPADFHHLRK